MASSPSQWRTGDASAGAFQLGLGSPVVVSCANPVCDFLRHSDAFVSPLFCCKACGVRQEQGHGHRRHGKKCEGRRCETESAADPSSASAATAGIQSPPRPPSRRQGAESGRTAAPPSSSAAAAGTPAPPRPLRVRPTGTVAIEIARSRVAPWPARALARREAQGIPKSPGAQGRLPLSPTRPPTTAARLRFLGATIEPLAARDDTRDVRSRSCSRGRSPASSSSSDARLKRLGIGS